MIARVWHGVVPKEKAEAYGYAGPDIERAHYYPYDLECLIDPELGVAHYEVVHTSGVSGS
jgi:hypothetical protein